MTSETPYPLAAGRRHSGVRERDIETALLDKLRELKYSDRPDIHDRATLEANFRQKFETLNRVRLTDGEFSRLLDELITPDVFTASIRCTNRSRWSGTTRRCSAASSAPSSASTPSICRRY